MIKSRFVPLRIPLRQSAIMTNSNEFVQDRDVSQGALQHLAALLPVVDFTAKAQTCPNCSCLMEFQSASDLLGRVAQRLCRSIAPHVLLTGAKGVGKTSMVELLARRAVTGNPIPLAGAKFLWIDCKNIGIEDSRACLESIFSAIAQHDERLVLCLDGLTALLKRPNGGTNKPLLRAMLVRPDLRLIGVMNDWEYNEQIASDAAMLDYFTRVQVEEPSEATALELTRHHAQALSKEFSLRIDQHVVERVVKLSSTFILGERHPAKAVRILRQVCEDTMFDKVRMGASPSALPLDRVIEAIAEKTGIPAETIAGEVGNADFEAALQGSVVGQDHAVAQVANELRLIKAGLCEPGKPAAVLMFAGMTGVGKTELAKRIAEIYSSSKRLQVYTMGNFTEPHSVSGIIGVPPGYVGYEEGGRLINELNADPYSVFLLDEAEKCHPNIWKPFLNLFDEGWIVDQRGVRAYADCSIFILTTNAGDRNISQMAKSGKTAEEISERVKQALSKVRHERSSQPVFPPQFLSRLRRVIVFEPLDQPAMVGIAERVCRRMQKLWLHKREKQVEIAEAVIAHIGRRADELNARANGEEGGRIVKKLVSEMIECEIQAAAMHRPNEYQACSVIRVGMSAGVVADIGQTVDGISIAFA